MWIRQLDRGMWRLYSIPKANKAGFVMVRAFEGICLMDQEMWVRGVGGVAGELSVRRGKSGGERRAANKATGGHWSSSIEE